MKKKLLVLFLTLLTGMLSPVVQAGKVCDELNKNFQNGSVEAKVAVSLKDFFEYSKKANGEDACTLAKYSSRVVVDRLGVYFYGNIYPSLAGFTKAVYDDVFKQQYWSEVFQAISSGGAIVSSALNGATKIVNLFLANRGKEERYFWFQTTVVANYLVGTRDAGAKNMLWNSERYCLTYGSWTGLATVWIAKTCKW